MFRDSVIGNPVLTIFRAMVMIFANLLAEAGARIATFRLGRVAALFVSPG